MTALLHTRKNIAEIEELISEHLGAIRSLEERIAELENEAEVFRAYAKHLLEDSKGV